MKKFTIAAPLLVVAGATVSLAAWYATAAQDRGRPAEGPGPPGKGAPGPGGPGFGPGTFLAPEIVDGSDADGDGRLSPSEAGAGARRFIARADADKKGSIDAQALGRAINRSLPPPPGFGPDGPPGDGPDGPPRGGPPGGPGGDFGPGTFLAPQIVQAADANKDGRLSADEAAAFAEKFVREADAEKKGSIDSDALASAMNQRMGPPGGFGPGGPGGPGGQEIKLVKDYDKDGDGRLNAEERKPAREAAKKKGGGRGFGPPGFGPPGGGPPGGGPGGPRGFGPPGFGGREEPAKEGPHVDVADVPTYAEKDLYDPSVLRTIFLTFENKDWESELEDFHGTDVEVPAVMIVDGRKYPGVGVHFRGMSSYGMVRAGHKRSLNVSVDHTDDTLRIGGHKTLNLLNSHEDPSFLHTVIYSHIARQYIPAPKANLVRVVVNGESWGVYANVQQFDKIFQQELGPDHLGARWKVRGNPGADGGLTYVGEDLDEYKRRYEMKSGKKEDWLALVALCKALKETPAERLESVLAPMLDIDNAVKFLALDNALINNDGYWTRASDYSLYRDAKGRFHLVPHDMNEAFGPPMMFGPGGPRGPRMKGAGPQAKGDRPAGKGAFGPGGPGPQGVALDPLVGLENARTPLRGRLLAVPALRDRYLEHVRKIAEDSLDWRKLGPVVASYRTLAGEAIEADTRKLTSYAAFQAATADSTEPEAAPGERRGMSLRAFADQRRKYLLDHLEHREQVR